MKKKIAIMLVCALTATMVLAGCNNSEEEKEEEEESTEEGNSDEEMIPAADMLAYTEYDVLDYVTLPDDYMDLTVELDSNYEVTDEDIQEYVETYILAYYPIYVDTDKTVVEDGDTVDIDYVGTVDGEEFDGGSAEDYDLLIGSGTFIDGFEDGLIGQDVGSTVVLDLTFPEDYSSEDLAGKDVEFTVTINAIVEEETLSYDELNDEYVEENFAAYGLTTVDELIEDAKTSLESENDSEEANEIQEKILDQLVEGSTIDYPEELLEERFDDYKEQLEEGAEEYDMDYEDYILTYSEYDDVETFEEDTYDQLKEYLDQELVLEAIVAEQDLDVSQSEFDAFVDTYVAYYGFADADEFYEYYGDEDYVKLGFAENRALNEVMEAATIVYPDGREESGADVLGALEEAEEEAEAEAEAAEEAEEESESESESDSESDSDSESETETEE